MKMGVNGLKWQRICGRKGAIGLFEICAHENGCEWNENTCEKAAMNGHLACLKYACDNKCLEYEKYLGKLRKIELNNVWKNY